MTPKRREFRGDAALGLVKVMSDSAHDLPPHIISAYGIATVPMMIYFGDEEFKDGVNLSTHEFYQRLTAGPHLPKTAQPLLSEMRQTMLDLTDDGSELVVIMLSSGLSGTSESAAMLVGEMPDRRIRVIDSLSASLGEGLLVWFAAEMARQGADAAAIEAAVTAKRSRLSHLFVLDTLEYLFKGGRVTKTEAFMGTVLDVKPILHIGNDGRITPLGRARGRAKAVARLLELAEQNYDPATQRVGVIHAHCPEEGEEFAAQLRARLSPKELIFTEMSATIGTHVGPGLLGIVFETEGGRV